MAMDRLHPQRPDLTLLRQRAEDARDLLAPDGVFMNAVAGLHRQYMAELTTARNDQNAQNLIVARMQVLEDIAAMIRKAMTDYSVEARKQAR